MAFGLVMGVLAGTGGTVRAGENAMDLPGSRDLSDLKRFSRSHIVEYHEDPEPLPHLMILGPLKKVNNSLAPKQSSTVEGKRTAVTYRIPDGATSDGVYEYFRAQLTALNAEFLYQCTGRECGSSSLWANSVFDDATLYGPEKFQHFVLARLADDATEKYVSVYAMQRGNRRLYARIDLVESATRPVDSKEAIVTILREHGRYLLRGVEFDEDGNLLAGGRPVISAAAAALAEVRSLSVFVVGHARGGRSLERLLTDSRNMADQVTAELIEQGAPGSAVSSQGVGPLASSISDTRFVELVVDGTGSR